MSRSRHSVLLALTLIAEVGCTPSPNTAQSVSPSACEPGDRVMVRDVLYFGRSKPTGVEVNDGEWDGFLATVVTPRFPDGLTVVPATGQWRGASGKIVRERAEILTLLHAGDSVTRQAVAAIASEYKNRFGQEAVLRERSQVCVTFHAVGPVKAVDSSTAPGH
jgi:hypothetical protein